MSWPSWMDSRDCLSYLEVLVGWSMTEVMITLSSFPSGGRISTLSLSCLPSMVYLDWTLTWWMIWRKTTFHLWGCLPSSGKEVTPLLHSVNDYGGSLLLWRKVGSPSIPRCLRSLSPDCFSLVSDWQPIVYLFPPGGVVWGQRSSQEVRLSPDLLP
jgi:hypothetical protein